MSRPKFSFRLSSDLRVYGERRTLMSVRKVLGLGGYLVFILAVFVIGEVLYSRFFERLPPLRNEVYLQCFAPALHQISSIDGLHYELKPNASSPGFLPGVTWKINSRGMRNDEIPLQKKKFRVLVMGDSVAFGANVKYEQLFTSVAQQFLAQRSVEVEVINASVSAYNTRQEYLALCSRYLDLHPDLIVFAFCVNDTAESGVQYIPKLFAAEADMEIKHYRNVTRAQYIAVVLPRQFPLSYQVDRWLLLHSGVYRALSILRFKQTHHLHDLSSLPNYLFGIDFEGVLGDTKKLEARLKVPIRFLILPAKTRWNSKEIMACFNRHGLVTWDLDQVTRKYCQGYCDYWVDEVHLTASGHRLVGEFLAKRIKPLVPVTVADAAKR